MAAPARYLKRKLVITPREALVAGGPPSSSNARSTITSGLAAGPSSSTCVMCPCRQRRDPSARPRAHDRRTDWRSLSVAHPNEQVRALLAVSHLDRILHLGDAAFMTPARWAAVRLVVGGGVLVAGLMWVGSVLPLPPEMNPVVPGISAGGPTIAQALGLRRSRTSRSSWRPR